MIFSRPSSARVWRKSWTGDTVFHRLGAVPTRGRRLWQRLDSASRALWASVSREVGITRYRALAPVDRRALRAAFIWLLLVDIALRTVGLRRLVPGAHSVLTTRSEDVNAEDLRRASRYAYWLDVAARHHIVRARCLHKSLALHLWLRREGVPSDVRIGVRKTDGGLTAHAWVELGGYIVNDEATAVAEFTRLGQPMAHPDGRHVDMQGTAMRTRDIMAPHGRSPAGERR